MKSTSNMIFLILLFSCVGCQKDETPPSTDVVQVVNEPAAPITKPVVDEPDLTLPVETRPETTTSQISINTGSKSEITPAESTAPTRIADASPVSPVVAVPDKGNVVPFEQKPSVTAVASTSARVDVDFCSAVQQTNSAPAAETIQVVTRGLVRKPEASAKLDAVVRLTGNGRASNSAQADQLALQDLQDNIADSVRKNPANCNAAATAMLGVCRQTPSSTVLQDEVPILGVVYTRSSDSSGARLTEAILSSSDSLPAYEKQLDADRRQLEDLFTQIQNAPTIENKRKIMVHLQRYLGLAVVSATLGQKQALQQADAVDRIFNSVASFQNVQSVDDAAAVIASALIKDNVQIFPARQYNALEITPFAAALVDKLKSKQSTRSASSDKSRFMLTGSYRFCNNGDMLLNYQLMGRDNLVSDSINLRVPKDVYSRYRAQANYAEFDQTFLNKVSADQGFRSDITSSLGNHDLLLRDGESIQFYARLTQPGYFYIVGHVAQQDGKRFSYLLELNDVPGADKFVTFVPPDKVNQYIDLGEYTMGEPFGTEYLQLIASSQPPSDSLPRVRWDEKLELNVIENSQGASAAVVERVRAAKKVKKQQGNVRTHESALSYTTIPAK